MRTSGARQLCALSAAVGALAMAAMSSCGDSASDSERSVPQTTASVVTSDLDSVAHAWGKAFLTNDWASVAGLIEPSDQRTISDQLDAMESVTPPGKVTLNEFAFEVVAQEAGSAEVRYSGERCAPTTSRTFGPTTVVGGPGSDSTSLSSDGIMVEGEIVCADLEAVEAGPLSPARFVEIDGQWYGVLPGL